jgi:hypothetical protein
MMVVKAERCAALVLVSLLAVSGCHRTTTSNPQKREISNEQEMAQNPNGLPSLKDAQNKLEDAITQPASSFHLTYKKDGSDGYSCFYDVEISPAGIQGSERLVRPKSNAREIDDSTGEVRRLDGTPIGSNAWRFIANDLLSSLGSDLQYAETGLKYAEEESTGGFDTRRFDFDMTDIAAGNKAAPVNAGFVSNLSAAQQAKYYSFKGSAWIAKDNGRLVKAQYDHVSTFTDGAKASMHYDLSITKE